MILRFKNGYAQFLHRGLKSTVLGFFYGWTNYQVELNLLNKQWDYPHPWFQIECWYSNRKQDHDPSFYFSFQFLRLEILEFQFVGNHHVGAGWAPLDNKPEGTGASWEFCFPRHEADGEDEEMNDGTAS